MTGTSKARQSQRKGAMDVPRMVKSGQCWHVEALKVAHEVRGADPLCSKREVVSAIVERMPDVPVNRGTLLRWLGEKEDTGEFPRFRDPR